MCAAVPAANTIVIHELRRRDLRGATIIDGFPSVGLVSSICASYLVKVLRLDLIGTMDSPAFPTISLVRDGRPMSPVRIYGGEKMPNGDQLVVVVAEFQVQPQLIRPIVRTLIDWAEEQRCRMIVSPEGLVVDAEVEREEGLSETVFGIGSTERARRLLAQNHIASFEEGVITGVAGLLLNEGRRRDFDVVTLLAEAHPDYPDARAAALVVDAIDRLLLGIEFDAQPLFEEAERIETQLREFLRQTQRKGERELPRPSLYA